MGSALVADFLTLVVRCHGSRRFDLLRAVWRRSSQGAARMHMPAVIMKGFDDGNNDYAEVRLRSAPTKHTFPSFASAC